MSARTAGGLVVISGPSGSGKTSVCRALKEDPAVVFSVSATTRPQRPGERDGVDYHFLDHAGFERRIAEGDFLEWAEYNDHLYGTLKAPMERVLAEGRVFVLEIEVQGTRQLRENGVEGLYLFIVPPDMETLRRRLIARGTNTDAEIAERLEIARRELEARELYDHVIPNHELGTAIAEVRRCIGLDP